MGCFVYIYLNMNRTASGGILVRCRQSRLNSGRQERPNVLVPILGSQLFWFRAASDTGPIQSVPALRKRAASGPIKLGFVPLHIYWCTADWKSCCFGIIWLNRLVHIYISVSLGYWLTRLILIHIFGVVSFQMKRELDHQKSSMQTDQGSYSQSI